MIGDSEVRRPNERTWNACRRNGSPARRGFSEETPGQEVERDRQQRAQNRGQPRSHLVDEPVGRLAEAQYPGNGGDEDIPRLRMRGLPAGKDRIRIEAALMGEVRGDVMDGAHVIPGIVVLEVHTGCGHHGVVRGDHADRKSESVALLRFGVQYARAFTRQLGRMSYFAAQNSSSGCCTAGDMGTPCVPLPCSRGSVVQCGLISGGVRPMPRV